jgi:hypothetical protein
LEGGILRGAASDNAIRFNYGKAVIVVIVHSPTGSGIVVIDAGEELNKLTEKVSPGSIRASFKIVIAMGCVVTHGAKVRVPPAAV